MQKLEGPSVSRRNVVVGLWAAGLVAACSGGGMRRDDQQMDAAPMAAQQGQALATGNMDRWASMVGKEFDTSGFRVKVAGVSALPSVGRRPPDVTREAAFLVVFDVISGGQMPGDLIYTLTSPTHVLDVFISTGASSEFPNRMLAVFN